MKIVIVGAGPAGVSVAETLRQYDDRPEIVMLSREPFPPYSPPALMEYCLTGQEVHFWKGKDFLQRLGVDYRPGTGVESVSPQQHKVRLADGQELPYDQLVLAAGSRVYAPVAGGDKPGVYDFKSLTAAEELLAEVRQGQARSAVIIGAGFIGVEVGLLLADLGIEVTQLVRSRVMRTTLDPETSEIVLQAMQERGIQVRRDAEARAFAGEPRAEAVELSSGDRLAADILVGATGLKPNTQFLEGSGIETRWGVVVDDHLRTNLPDVYALGDLAETANRVTGERDVYPNFPNAVAQGTVVGCNLLGWNLPYEGADRMNSLKHLGINVVAVGQTEGEELRLRYGNVLRKLYLREGRINGFRLVGDTSGAGIYRTLMNRKVNVEAFRDRLMEPGFGMGWFEDIAAAAALEATGSG